MYQPWEPNTDGRWHSTRIDVAIALEGVLATVYTRDGRRMLHEGEVETERERLRAEAETERERLQAELTRREEELEHLRRLLDEKRLGPDS